MLFLQFFIDSPPQFRVYWLPIKSWLDFGADPYLMKIEIEAFFLNAFN
jgi:hypothetical protein